MSVSDLLKLADDKLAEVFHRKAHDPAKSRAKHVKSIDAAKEQFGRPEPVRGRKSWKASNNVVEYNSSFPINGKSKHYVPSERFNDFLEKLKNLVTTGHFDADIDAASNDTSASFGTRGGRRKMTEEEKVARRARMEAKGTAGKGGRGKKA